MERDPKLLRYNELDMAKRVALCQHGSFQASAEDLMIENFPKKIIETLGVVVLHKITTRNQGAKGLA